MANLPAQAAALNAALLDSIAAIRHSDARPVTSETERRLVQLFEAQCLSRHVDLIARSLRQDGRGYYTIGSAGHEANAIVAQALLPTDPALLHYRSGGFYMARSLQAATTGDPVDDVLLGMLAATPEPIAGGRHKVFGHPQLAVIPQTSTIASHLPRAVGTAFAIGRGAKIGADLRWPSDAVTVCSFGDASANHSTALGAINAACHLAYQRLPVPLLFVCEDNGIGISTRTPHGWIHASFSSRPSLRYVAVDGQDTLATTDACDEVVEWVRRTKQPAFLHLSTVRYLGHAGTDVEAGYRTPDEIRRSYESDPLLGTARALVECGHTPDSVIARYLEHGRRVEQRATALLDQPELTTAEEVMAPIATRYFPTNLLEDPVHSADAERVTMAQAINATLVDELTANPATILFGEDVAVKGGVYGVTKGLLAKFGAARVFDTLLDEQSILGVALGAAVSGLTPIPEIQYLAYLHNAEDQLRGEAATLSFFSQGAFRNGMVIRIAGYAYQKGFGGHFHNDDSIAVLRDIPGIVIASPARAGDASGMLRSCLAAARTDGTVCVFLEPIALYHTTDLHHQGDGGWVERVRTDAVPIGEARRYGPAEADVTIVTWGNGLFMSLRVAARLGIAVNVIDLRWIAPLPLDAVMASAPTRILVVDETRRSGGVSEGIVTGLIDRGFSGPLARVTSKDSFIPLGAAANLVLLSEEEITAAVEQLAKEPR